MRENVIAEKALPKKLPGKMPKLPKETGVVICIILTIIMTTAAILLSLDVIPNVLKESSDRYNAAAGLAKDAAYEGAYRRSYDHAEAKSHVTNRASIYVESLRETKELEVLKVHDVEFVVENSSSNPGHVTSWLKVPGNGVFVVNLPAECIVDQERSHVRVRLPRPELKSVDPDYGKIKVLLFKNDQFNDSYKLGEELARKQLTIADYLIRKEFTSNENYYVSAQKAARGTIECLIRELNPGIEDLKIDVEFY